MLTIRPAQMQVFQSHVREHFVLRLTARLSQDYPRLAGSSFHSEVTAMVERAIGYGFRDKGDIASWAALECRYGFGFADLPGYAQVKDILELDLAAATKIHKIARRLDAGTENE